MMKSAFRKGGLAPFRKLKRMLGYLANELPDQMRHLERGLDENARSIQQLEQRIALNKISSTEIIDRSTRDFLEIELQTKACMQLLSDMDRRENREFGNLNTYLSYGDFVNPEIMLLHNRRANDGKKQLLMIGFYGAYNFGDELMLQTLLKILDDLGDIHVTLMLSENPDYDASINGNVDIIHYCRTRSDFSHLASYFDALIVGGGALLDDKAYGNTSHHFISLATIVAELPNYFSAKRKPTCFLGLSTNDVIKESKYVGMLTRCVQGARYFSVRDPFSREVMRTAGIPIENVEVVEDIALANEFWLKARGRRSQNGGKRCSVTWVNDEKMKPLLIQLIEELVQMGQSMGKEIHIDLVPMYDYLEVDKVYFADAIQKLTLDAAGRVTITPYPMTLEQTAEIFECEDAAINVRYHASLICASLGIPQTQVVLANHAHYPNKMRWIEEQFKESVTTIRTNQTAESISQAVWVCLHKSKCNVISKKRVRNNVKHLKRALLLSKGEKFK